MMHLVTLLLAMQSAPAGQTGIQASATTTVRGEPATFDLAGFRLGMSEAQVEQVAASRRLTERRRMRTKSFDVQVRDLANLRGAGLTPGGSSVLDSAEFDDGQGGRIFVRMLVWPSGARVRSVAYLPPAGTSVVAWRALLTQKYGTDAVDSARMDGRRLHAVWCGQASCSGVADAFSLVADVGAADGQIVLSQPEGTSSRAATLMEEAAARLVPKRAPGL